MPFLKNPPKRKSAAPSSSTAADYFKAKLGFKPSQRPFRTTANRQCGGCMAVKPGSDFACPVTPGRPDLNMCRDCS